MIIAHQKEKGVWGTPRNEHSAACQTAVVRQPGHPVACAHITPRPTASVLMWDSGRHLNHMGLASRTTDANAWKSERLRLELAGVAGL